MLVQLDLMKLYMREIDSSNFGNEMALYQEGNDKMFDSIAFDSRKLQGAELYYLTHEKKLLSRCIAEVVLLY